jgi:hypothetical protein
LVEPLPPAAALAIPITANRPTTGKITVSILWRAGQDWRGADAGWPGCGGHEGGDPCGGWPGPADGGGW